MTKSDNEVLLDRKGKDVKIPEQGIGEEKGLFGGKM